MGPASACSLLRSSSGKPCLAIVMHLCDHGQQILALPEEPSFAKGVYRLDIRADIQAELSARTGRCKFCKLVQH